MGSKKRFIDFICEGIVWFIVKASEAFCIHSWRPHYSSHDMLKRCNKCFAERKITEKSTLPRILFCKKDFVLVTKDISAEDLKKSFEKNIPIIYQKVCLCCGTTKYTT